LEGGSSALGSGSAFSRYLSEGFRRTLRDSTDTATWDASILELRSLLCILAIVVPGSAGVIRPPSSSLDIAPLMSSLLRSVWSLKTLDRKAELPIASWSMFWRDVSRMCGMKCSRSDLKRCQFSFKDFNSLCVVTLFAENQVSEYFDFQVNMIHTEGPSISSPPSGFRTLSLSSTPYGLPSFHGAAGVHLLGAWSCISWFLHTIFPPIRTLSSWRMGQSICIQSGHKRRTSCGGSYLFLFCPVFNSASILNINLIKQGNGGSRLVKTMHEENRQCHPGWNVPAMSVRREDDCDKSFQVSSTFPAL